MECGTSSSAAEDGGRLGEKVKWQRYQRASVAYMALGGLIPGVEEVREFKWLFLRVVAGVFILLDMKYSAAVSIESDSGCQIMLTTT